MLIVLIVTWFVVLMSVLPVIRSLKAFQRNRQLKPLNHYVRSFGIVVNATVKSTEIKDRLRPTPVENMSAITVIGM